MKKTNKNNYDPDYIAYLEHGESAAVYIVRDIVNSIDTNNKWIDVLDVVGNKNYDDQWDIKKIRIELFPRKIKPQYPKFGDKKYITWKTAHEDIFNQRENGYKGPIFEVSIRLINKNKGKKKIVEKAWNKRFGQYVPKNWYMESTYEIRKVKVEVEPEWEYHILTINRFR